jgi:drug/metabolite transporter (DMT)-like permease
MMSGKTKAVLFMLASSVSFSGMAAMVRIAGDLPVVEKVFVRNVVSLMIAGIVLLKQKAPIYSERRSLPLLFGRSAFGVLGVMAYFYAIERMHLADASMLNRLSPFFVLIIGAWLLREKLSRAQVPGTILVFLASLLVIKPRLDPEVIPALVGTAGALCAGTAYAMVRLLRKTERPATIVFFFSAFTALVTAPFVVMNPVLPSSTELWGMVGIGVFGAGGQFGLTLAYKHEKASEVSIYTYTQIVFNALIGFYVWCELPDRWSTLGGVLIILISALVYVDNRRQAHRTA